MDLTQTQKIALRPLRKARRHGLILLPFSLGLGVILWHLIARAGDFPAFILPTPDLVWKRFVLSISDGSLPRHFTATLSEVVAGLMLGISVATTLGYLLAKSKPVERLLSPYVVASQSIPIVAIAPLLIIWFGPGIISKILISALIVF
ncbi:MAG: ABC transporter permease, partial [Anaerolineales bacterium]|nr:ABC transporter permease [Anaerolineales bacterium]